MISSRPVLPRDARFRASTTRVYTHLASPPWLVWLIPLWTNLDRNSSFSVSRLSEIPQISVTKIVSRTAVGPAPSGLCLIAVDPAPSGLSPTAVLPSALPDYDRPLSLLTWASMLLMASNKNTWTFLCHRLKFDSQLFHLKRFKLHMNRPFRGHPRLSDT